MLRYGRWAAEGCAVLGLGWAAEKMFFKCECDCDFGLVKEQSCAALPSAMAERGRACRAACVGRSWGARVRSSKVCLGGLPLKVCSALRGLLCSLGAGYLPTLN
jgi:hypothetical protein